MGEAMRTQTVVTHQCYCVIVSRYLGSDDLNESRCGTWGLGPDQPFCHGCEDRHPGAAGMPWISEVTARLERHP